MRWWKQEVWVMWRRNVGPGKAGSLQRLVEAMGKFSLGASSMKQLYQYVNSSPHPTGGSVVRVSLQCRRHKFDPWVRKIPWRIPSRIFAWENPIDRGSWWAIVHGVTKIGHDWATEHAHQVRSGLPEL